MPEADAAANEAPPQNPIRHFDVFAEYTRQERREKGYSEDEAKGYGIWLAKVVASRSFGQKSSDGKKPTKKDAHEDEPKFRSVGDELQTDETFDHDIVDRMGAVLRRGLRAGDRQSPRGGQEVRNHPRHDPLQLETFRHRAEWCWAT